MTPIGVIASIVFLSFVAGSVPGGILLTIIMYTLLEIIFMFE